MNAAPHTFFNAKSLAQQAEMLSSLPSIGARSIPCNPREDATDRHVHPSSTVASRQKNSPLTQSTSPIRQTNLACQTVSPTATVPSKFDISTCNKIDKVPEPFEHPAPAYHGRSCQGQQLGITTSSAAEPLSNTTISKVKRKHRKKSYK